MTARQRYPQYHGGHTNLGQLDEAVVLLLAEVVEEVLVEARVLDVVGSDLQGRGVVSAYWLGSLHACTVIQGSAKVGIKVA